MADERRRNNKGQFTSDPGWFRNAAKSLGLAGIKVLEETMPATMDTININKDTVVDLARKVKNGKRKTNLGDIESQLSGKALEVWKQGKKIGTNALSDLKSGNFYNKEREEKNAAMYGMDDMDSDFDFSFDVSDDFNDNNFEDDNSSSDEPKVVVPTVNITSNINNNNPMVKAVEQQTRMMAQSESASYKRDLIIADTQMGLSKEIGQMLYGGMETINTNLSTLISFNNDQFGGYIGASLKYYEDTTSYLSQISEKLQILTEVKETEKDYKTNPMDQIFSSGGFNLGEYFNVVKKQLVQAIDEDMMLGSIKSFMTEGEGLEAIAQAPLREIPIWVVNKLVPEFLSTTLKSFDETFKSFLPALLMRVGEWGESGGFFGLEAIKSFFGKTFGIKNTGKTSIDLSNYEKGRVPFDGITRKSIIEVIPGYLSKILSALTGKDELIFDSAEGVFKTRKEVDSEYDKKVKTAATSQFESFQDIKDNLRALGLDDYNTADKYVDSLFTHLAQRSTPFNPNIVRDETTGIDRDDISDILNDVYGAADSKLVDAVRASILSLSNSKQLGIVGDQYKARQAVTELLEDFERGNNPLVSAKFNGLYGDKGDYTKDNPFIKGPVSAYLDRNSNVETKFTNSIFTPADRWGNTSLTYLRDIRRLLLEGIGVFNIGKPIAIGPDSDNIELGSSRLRKFQEDDDRRDITVSRYNAPEGLSRTMTPEEIAADLERGIRHYGSSYQLPDMETMQSNIKDYKAIQEGNHTSGQKGKHVFDRIIKFIFGSNSEKAEIMSNAVTGFKDRAANKFKGFFEYLDNSMYDLVFGTDKRKDSSGAKHSFFDRVGSSISGTLTRHYNKIHEKLFGEKGFFTELKESLFGQDGLITKFKNSEFVKSLKEKTAKAFNYLAGTLGEDGTRSGGLLSGVANNLKSMMDSTKLYITGVLKDKDGKVIKTNDKSVFSEIKSLFGGFKKSMKEYIFGNESENNKEKAKGLLTEVGGYFKQGMQAFTDAIFGQSYDKRTQQRVSNVSVDEITKKVKEGAPKALATGIVGGGLGLLAGAGGFGLLGSLFLGPMSGVVIGTAAGFLSQSDKFKNWLFGDIDKDGNRIGGIISKSTQDFFKKHKSAIIGGTALGTLKGALGIGILPSFILGGPITGALFGMSASLIAKSETFQKLMFGNIDEDTGKRKGGIIGKTLDKANDGALKKIGFGAAGAALGAGAGAALSSFGILGSLAFGPLSGAIIGAGAGIALAANKWKDAIFGKFDKKTGEKTENGILSKMMAAVSIEVLQPAKVTVSKWALNVQDWFEDKIAEPFQASLYPIKESIKRMKNSVIELGQSILDKLHIPTMVSNIGKSIKGLVSDLVSPLTNLIKKGANAITKITGTIISSPFKAMQIIAEKMLLPAHMKQGIRDMRAQIIENIKNSDVGRAFTKYVANPIKSAITHVRDFAKKLIKGTFNLAWQGIKLIGKGAGKIIAGAVAAPFMPIVATFKGIGALKDVLSNLRKTGGRDTERLSDITSGNRNFLQSIGDLGKSFFSGSLRRAAQYTNTDAEAVRTRIINEATSQGETLSDKEIDKRVNRYLRQHPGGAGYFDKMEEARKTREVERNERKAKRDEIRKSLQGTLDKNQETGRRLGYNLLTDEEKKALSLKEYNKTVDDFYKKQYGSDYKKMSKIERDTFTENKESHDAVVSTEEKVRTIADVIKDIAANGIFIRKSKQKSKSENVSKEVTESVDVKNIDDAAKYAMNSAGKWFDTSTGKFVKKEVAESYINNSEKKTDDLKFNTLGTTIFERDQENAAKDSERKRMSVFDKIADLIKQGNDENKEHNKAWDFIFSKKGLITAAVIAALGLLQGGFGTITDVLGKIKEFLGINDKDGNRTDSSGDIQTNDNVIEATASGATRYGFKAVHAGANALKKGYDAVNTGYKATKGIIKTAGKKTVKGTTTTVADDAARYAMNSAGKWYDKTTGKFVKKEVAEAAIGNADNAAKAALTKSGKVVAKEATETAAANADNVAKYAMNSAGKWFDTSTGKFVKKEVAEAAIGNADNAAKAAKVLKNSGKEVVENASKSAVKETDKAVSAAVNSGIIDDFFKLLKSGYDNLLKAINKKFPNFAKHVIGSKVLNAITTILKTPASKLTKFISKITAGLGKIATSTATAYILDAAFVIYGGTTGATKSETANLFGVSQDDVNSKMQTASGIIKGFLSFSWFFVITIASDISESLLGVNIVRLLAQAIYSLLVGGDVDKIKELSDSQTDFDKIYTEYTQIQELLKGNAEINPDGSIKIKDPTKVESKDSYNDRMNSSVASKIGDSVKSGYNGVKSFLFGQNGNESTYNDTQAKIDQLKSLVDQNIIDPNSINYIKTMESLEKELEKSSTKNGLFSFGKKSEQGIGGPIDLLNEYRVTSEYNASDKSGIRSGKNHKGIDLSKGLNSPIQSFTDGTVEKIVNSYAPNSGFAPGGPGYGNYVIVKDKNGYYHRYAHLNAVNVNQGQSISEGTVIGKLGHTGNSTGAHLHYEVRKSDDKTLIDPKKYLSNYTSGSVSDGSDYSMNANAESNFGLAGLVSTISSELMTYMKPITTLTSNITTAFSNLLGLSSLPGTDNTSSDSSNTVVDTSSITGSDNAEKIWNFLTGKGLTNSAAAGIMGNLFAESGLIPNNLQNTSNKKLGLSDEQYTAAVDNGTYNNFVHDSGGYGLAQWTYYNRKQNLLDRAKSQGKSISDIGVQLGLLYDELKSYGLINSLNNAGSVKEASTIILKQFEKPKDQSDAVVNKRASFGEKYFNLYSGTGGSNETDSITLADQYNRFKTSNLTTTGNSIAQIIREVNSNNTVSANVIDYLKKIADGITSIVHNTGSTNSKLDEIKVIESKKSNNTNNVAVVDNSTKQTNSPMYDIASNRRNTRNNQGYNTAKLIASGAQ